MIKSTFFFAPFSIAMLVYQRVFSGWDEGDPGFNRPLALRRCGWVMTTGVTGWGGRADGPWSLMIYLWRLSIAVLLNCRVCIKLGHPTMEQIWTQKQCTSLYAHEHLGKFRSKENQSICGCQDFPISSACSWVRAHGRRLDARWDPTDACALRACLGKVVGRVRNNFEQESFD